MKGTIRVNPFNFVPSVSYETGKTITKRIHGNVFEEVPEVTTIRIIDDQIKYAHDNIGEEIEFEIVSLETDYAKIILEGSE